ncbi:MAG: hypothetical protein EXR49_01350 [Dehalococcoidia bacterium]|nr:hypothetical protein [Dehalococcoidia bacterium]
MARRKGATRPRPLHPYTYGLLRAVPRENLPPRSSIPIRGNPPDLLKLKGECPFLTRCNKARAACRQEPMPPLEEVSPGHFLACFNPIRHDWA